MKEFIAKNIATKPTAVLAGILLMYFVYTEQDKRAIAKHCQDQLGKKDEIIQEQSTRVQDMNQTLLDYAFQLKMKDSNEKETDSLLRRKTENNVKDILNNQ